MEGSKTLFCGSKFPGLRERISSKKVHQPWSRGTLRRVQSSLHKWPYYVCYIYCALCLAHSGRSSETRSEWLTQAIVLCLRRAPILSLSLSLSVWIFCTLESRVPVCSNGISAVENCLGWCSDFGLTMTVMQPFV
jgi:hypothetical protein